MCTVEAIQGDGGVVLDGVATSDVDGSTSISGELRAPIQCVKKLQQESCLRCNFSMCKCKLLFLPFSSELRGNLKPNFKQFTYQAVDLFFY